MGYIKRWISDEFDDDIEVEDVDFDDLFDEIEEGHAIEDSAPISIEKLFNVVENVRIEKKEQEEQEERERVLEAERKEKEIWNDHVEEVTSMDLSLDWSNFYDTDESTVGVEAGSISDGLIKSLNNLGYVDIEYISSITGGTDYKEIIDKLKGSIYQNPEKWGECFFHGWETKEEYLSGNIIHKLIEAKQSNDDYNGYFAENVKALEQLLPRTIDVNDIYVTLGSPWLPTWVVEHFIIDLMAECSNKKLDYDYDFLKVSHNGLTGSWEIKCTDIMTYLYLTAVDRKYGTRYYNRSALDIIQHSLNMSPVTFYDTVESNTTKSGTERVVNKEKTIEIEEKQKMLKERFKSWIWEDTDRKEKLYAIYEDRFLGIRTRQFSGEFLEFPGLNSNFQLYSYQKDAVARIIFSDNVLLAHDVGAGKTIVMVAAGMKLKQINSKEKILYVVPNNILDQWRSIFEEMYPNANLLIVDRHSFGKGKREDTLREIRDGRYDGIIITYTCFKDIPISKNTEIELIREKIAKITASIQNKNATNAAIKKMDALKKKLSKLVVEQDDEGIYFGELGITRLFVDEAHNFKNVPIDTSINNIKGLNTAGSSKCADMMDKVKTVQRANFGKGVVFATGTPITNSISDVYVMQMFLQSGTLELLDLSDFDGWVGMFSNPESNFEVDVDTTKARVVSRFSKFYNIPELTSILSQISDFHSMDESAGVPKHEGYVDVLINKTSDFESFLDDISNRVEMVRNRQVSRKEDNMLKITTDGRRAALDLRLVDESCSFTKCSKVFMCANNVARIYKETEDKKCTQLVFCDVSTPKDRFNLYDELKRILVSMGVNEKEITYIHSHEDGKSKEKLFKKVRNGEIRILIGSTFKLGLGVNVQDRLIALHHLDIPWRPSDMVQREGRILRQGNINPKVELYRYITEGSFDAYSWQILENKQRFISELLAGLAQNREFDDVDDTVLSYAEVKALAIGNEIIKERVMLANELSKYIVLQNSHEEKCVIYKSELATLPDKIKDVKEKIARTKEDSVLYEINKKDYTADERRALREKIIEATNLESPSKEDVVIDKYQGFDIIAPARVSIHHPVVKLVGVGKYSVEMVAKEPRVMAKIDNKLESLKKEYEELREKLTQYEGDRVSMKQYLETEHNYQNEIECCRRRIAEIDEELELTEDAG